MLRDQAPMHSLAKTVSLMSYYSLHSLNFHPQGEEKYRESHETCFWISFCDEKAEDKKSLGLFTSPNKCLVALNFQNTYYFLCCIVFNFQNILFFLLGTTYVAWSPDISSDLPPILSVPSVTVSLQWEVTLTALPIPLLFLLRCVSLHFTSLPVFY